MHVTEVLARLGGVGDATTLIAATSRRRVRTALRNGDIVRLGQRGYALPIVSEGRKAAQSLSGVMSGLTAAAYWSWEVKHPPARPQVTVPYKRRWLRLAGPESTSDGATSTSTTCIKAS